VPTDRLPNLFIVGAQKCGTSSLTMMLKFHPEVFMSFPKEPGYLAFGESGYTFPGAHGKPGDASRYVVTSEADYLGLFESAGVGQKILGEASTWYLTFPGMASRLKAFNPEAKVVVILRNPVDRAYSAWCHARRDNIESCESFAEALAMEQRRQEPDYLLRYRELGEYAAPLREFQGVFGWENLLVLFYEDLRDDPEDLWDQLCRFLDIETIAFPPRRVANRSGNPRSKLLQKVLKSHGLKSILVKLFPYTFLTWLKMRVDSFDLRKFPPLEGEVRLGLVDYYRDDINAVMEITGRDLNDWLV